MRRRGGGGGGERTIVNFITKLNIIDCDVGDVVVVNYTVLK